MLVLFSLKATSQQQSSHLAATPRHAATHQRFERAVWKRGDGGAGWVVAQESSFSDYPDFFRGLRCLAISICTFSCSKKASSSCSAGRWSLY